MDNAKVFELGTLLNTIKSLSSINTETVNHCKDGIKEADIVLQQTQEELRISESLLNVARADEAIKFARQLEADARMARAMVEEAAAIASGNPVAIAPASAEVASAGAELAQATEEYQQAVQHRERLEHRYELAQKCVSIAQEMCDTLQLRFNYSQAIVAETIVSGNVRLQQAYDDLSRYLSRLSPAVRAEVESFYSYEPEKNKPVIPKDVHDRLNASSGVVNAILEYLYCTDLKFRGTVDRLCQQLHIPGNEASVERTWLDDLVKNWLSDVSRLWVDGSRHREGII